MAMKHGCRSHALIVRQKTPHACPHNVLLGRIRHLQDLRDIRTRRRGKDEHNARRATNTVFTSILTSRQLAHGEAPSEDSPICSPNSLKRRRGIAGASEAPPLARRCKVDRKESVTIHAGYLRLPWDAWMKAQRFATTRQSNFNPGGLAHMNIGSDPIIHAEYVRRLLHGELYDDYDETPSRGAKRERSHVGCRKVSVESWNPSPSKKIRISRRQRREPRQYPRAIPLPTHRRRKHVNPGVVRSGSERTSRSPIDVPGPVPKRILPSDSTLPACSQMVAMLKRASAHICEIQEQERIIPRTVIYQESTSKQPRFIEFPAMATDDEPSIRAGGADIATSSAPSVIVGLGDSFNAVPVPTLDIQMCVLSLADRDAEMFAATRLNDDLRNDTSPDFSIVRHEAFVMSDTQSMLIDGISAQPSVPPATSASWTDIIPADKQDPYQLPIGLDLSFFDNIEAHTTTDTCVFTGESFSEHDAIFEFACEDYCSTFFSSSEQRSDAPGVKNPDNRCAISPRVGLGETGNDKEVVVFIRDVISCATNPSFEAVSSQQPVGSPVLFSNHEVIVEFASEGYCSSFSEQQSDAPGGVKELDSQITILPRVVLGEIRESNNDGPVVFTRDASSCAGVPSFEEVSPKEPLRSRPSPRVSVDRQLANNSFSFKLILESLAHNPESLSYMVEPFPPPCSNVPANECLAVDGASTSGTIIFTANDSVFSALCALPVVDADSDTSCADLTLVIEGSKSPVAAPAKTMCPLSESIPDNIKVIHDALLEADVTLVGQDNAQGDDVPEVHTNDQAAEMYNIESAYTAYFLSTPWPAPGRTRCKDGGWTTSHCIVLGEDGPGPGDYEEADAFIRDAISWATDSFCPTTLPVPVCISQPPSPESSPDSLEPVTGQMIPEKFVDADYEREIESQVEDTLAAIMLLLDVGDGDN